jgi:hypothetical protein
MKSIFDPVVRSELIERANKLTPNSQRQFGTMTPDQSLHHINLMLKASLGETAATFSGSNFKAALVRRVVISPMPIPKGKTKAPSQLVASGHYDLEAEKQEFKGILDRLASKDSGYQWPVHPLFGKMTRKQHGLFAYKESNHHLKQFGV